MEGGLARAVRLLGKPKLAKEESDVNAQHGSAAAFCAEDEAGQSLLCALCLPAKGLGL